MSDVLRRKLGTRRAPRAANSVSVEAVLRKVMPRDADTVLSLDLAVTGVTTVWSDRDTLLEAMGACHLAFLMESEAGLRGAILLDPDLLAGIIEFQLSGRVSERPVSSRPPTRTDAVVVGEILDAWLATAESAMKEVGLEAGWPAIGFERVPGHLSRREIALLLEPVEFRSVDIVLSLYGGAKTGLLSIATPRIDASHDGHIHSTPARVRTHIPDLPVALHAVLTRLPVAMMKARRLEPDVVFPLPDGCLQNVRLETSAGRLIRLVQLGRVDGKRAVRLGRSAHKGAVEMLSAPPHEAFAPAPSGLPELPESVEGSTAVTGLKDLPGVGALPELPGFPALPELPELPDLP